MYSSKRKRSSEQTPSSISFSSEGGNMFRTPSRPECPGGCTFVTRGLQSANQYFQFQGPTYLNINSFFEPGHYSVRTYYEGNAANVFGGTMATAMDAQSKVPHIRENSAMRPSGNPSGIIPFASALRPTAEKANPSTFAAGTVAKTFPATNNAVMGNPAIQQGNGAPASGIPRGFATIFPR